MKFWLSRRPENTPAPPRGNPTWAAVLEHDLLGIAPEPGTAAALALSLRRLGRCFEHDPVATTRSHGLCTRCGVALVLGDDGDWRPCSA